MRIVLGYGSRQNLPSNPHQSIFRGKIRGLAVKYSNSELRVKTSRNREYWDGVNSLNRREVIGLVSGVSSLLLMEPFSANGAGLPPEEKPKLCDDACEKELENVW